MLEHTGFQVLNKCEYALVITVVFQLIQHLKILKTRRRIFLEEQKCHSLSQRLIKPCVQGLEEK